MEEGECAWKARACATVVVFLCLGKYVCGKSDVWKRVGVLGKHVLVLLFFFVCVSESMCMGMSVEKKMLVLLRGLVMFAVAEAVLVCARLCMCMCMCVEKKTLSLL